MNKVRHDLGLSGGKDSSALAVYMNQKYPEIEMEYFFTDTGYELDETYDFLNKLKTRLDRPIAYLKPRNSFDFYMRKYNNFLPSATARWCTINMKLKPFEDWIEDDLKKGVEIFTYVGIRYDERGRVGYKPTNPLLKSKFPFIDDCIDKSGVHEILRQSGLGLPDYYKWRSRSGCSFCFFQRKIEWVNLKERYPPHNALPNRPENRQWPRPNTSIPNANDVPTPTRSWLWQTRQMRWRRDYSQNQIYSPAPHLEGEDLTIAQRLVSPLQSRV